MPEVVTIANAGLISGNGVTSDGDGVDVDGLVNITNTGTIVSLSAYADTSEGVTVGGGTITNSGTIEGSVINVSGTNTTAVGRGITLAGIDHTETSGVETDIPIQKIYGTTIVSNSGLIKGDSNAGIGILGITGTTNYSVTITNTLGGTIEGNSSTVAAIDGSSAITVSGTGAASANNETVINYGTIKQDGTGKAISLGSGSNSVQIIGGSASVIGDMSGGTTSGTNTLSIDPGTGQTFSYNGAISNFYSVQIKSGTVALSGASTYTGTTTVSGGKLGVNGSVAGDVTVSTGAEVGGYGSINGTISGAATSAGSVGPGNGTGNKAGILTALATNPTGTLTYNFEFTQGGAPTWNTASASGNDVLHLTAALGFTTALTSSNTVDLYFSQGGLTFDGGFFTNGSSTNNTLTANITNATFNYFVLDTTGTSTYNGSNYDKVTGSATTVFISGANFSAAGGGTVDGWTEQFSAVPEPSTYVLFGIGALVLIVISGRRGQTKRV